MSSRIVKLKDYKIDPVGNVILDSNSLKSSLVYETQWRVIPNSNLPNSLGYPTLEQYLQREALEDFAVSNFSNGVITTVGSAFISGGSPVAAAIADASASMSLHSSFSVAQALLIEDAPLIDGTVTDETPGRDDGSALLGGRATSFDGVDQRALSDYLTNGNFKQIDNINDPTTVRCVFRAPTAAGNQNFWSFQTAAKGGIRLYGFSSTTVRLQWINSSSSPEQISTSETTWPLMDGEWHEVIAVFDGNDMILYIDGREAYRAVGTTLNANADENIAFGVSESGNSDYGECDIVTWQLWKNRAMTVQEVRDLYLNRIDLGDIVNTPDVSFLFDGPNIFDQGAAQLIQPGLAGTTDPARVENANIPIVSTDLNSLGYSFGNEGRVIIPRVTGDTYTFKFRAPAAESEFIFLHEVGGTNNYAGVLTDGSGNTTVLQDATSLTIDGVEFSGSTRDDLHTELCDDVEHEVIITMGSDYANNWTNAEWGTYPGFELDQPSSYCRLIQINGVDITPSDVDYTTSTVLVPKRIGAELDAQGGPLTITGPLRRDGQLTGAPCIDLDAANSQYGITTGFSIDYSSEDWVLECYVYFTTASNDRAIFTQGDGGGTGRTWLFFDGLGTGDWYTFVGGTGTAFSTITPPAASKSYRCTLTHDATAQTLTLSVENLTDGGLSQETLSSINMESASGEIIIGSTKAGANYFDGQVWGVSLTCSTDTGKSRKWPISEGNGTRSHDVSENGDHIDWTGTADPTWSTQDVYFYGRANGQTPYADMTANDGTDNETFGPITALNSLDTSLPFRVEFTVEMPNGAVNSAGFVGRGGVQFRIVTYFTTRLRFDYGNSSLFTPSGAGSVFSGAGEGDLFDIVCEYDGAGTASITVNGTTWTGSITPSTDTNVGHYIGKNAANQEAPFRFYRFKIVHNGTTILHTEDMKFDLASGEPLPIAVDGAGAGNLVYGRIPALDGGTGTANGYDADGSADAANGISEPAGPYHYDDGVSIDFAPVANTQWTNYRWQDATFNGTTSKITWNGDTFLNIHSSTGTAFEAAFIWNYADASGGTTTILGNGNALRAFETNQNSHFMRTNWGAGAGYESTPNDFLVPDEDNRLEISYPGSDTFTITNTTLTNGTEVYSRTEPDFIQNGQTYIEFGGAGSTYSAGDGRNVSYDSTIDSPLAGNSLDLSANCNHGTDTDVTYNVNADAEWVYGDTQANPVNVVSSNGVESNLISFTSGV